MLIDILTFRLSDGVEDAAFLAADDALQHAQSPLLGFTRRTTARDDAGGWAVVSLWDSAETADAGRESGEWAAFEALLDPGSIDRRRYTTLD